jgi:DnaJ-class molecular chaperone
MRYCSNCGEPAEEDDSYCSSCGEELRGRTGGHQDIYVHTKMPCPRCGGTGRTADSMRARLFNVTETCRDCDGTGLVWD